ncbi:hypothetical protein PATSB16_24090 [Pandoraea thiooxydans]|uniref:TetR family transcriptional regulator n=1 Tax=Pandoraea thiooxydans TaxID=445709 RepID=A0A0G3ESW9_9BURK|nr:TetR/AcrR family transcriptional regulator [Pandoraea thiooxydans]AKJ68397.1 TetR family transcriptional regulator [Pandoraea thiooxydans]APR95749.1 hypothetical protein PATSB16_24090 [Pandoraea thiooxydans]
MNTVIKKEASRPRPARRTQEQRSDTTRQQIIQSALTLLREKGVRGANLQEIARGAQVTLGALQHHFPNRQILMERLIDEVMSPLSDQGAVWPSASLPLAQRASAFVRTAWQTMYGIPSYVAAWSLFFGCKASPELFERINANRVRADPEFFRRFLEHFPEIAAYHPNPEQFGGFVFASLRGMGIFNLFPISKKEIDGQLNILVQVIVQAGTTGLGSRSQKQKKDTGRR